MNAHPFAILIAVLVAAGFSPVTPVSAGRTGVMAATEFSAQTRPRPRVRVYREQPAAFDYPRPGDYSWPGPGAVRHCVDWYATEYRPSGTVVTPQMRCRWVRG